MVEQGKETDTNKRRNIRIVVNHLTRITSDFVCVAGVDVKRGTHVCPVPSGGPLKKDVLARHRRAFDIGNVVDLGVSVLAPEKPHIENVVVRPSRASVYAKAPPDKFWQMLTRLARRSLRDIFGKDLVPLVRLTYGTKPGEGDVSLGCLIPSERPYLHVVAGPLGKPEIFNDTGATEIYTEVPVADLRLYSGDFGVPDRKKVVAAANRLSESKGIILGVGLTRIPGLSAEHPHANWLQVNNIHLKEDPIRQLEE